jgi:TldD protein
MSDNATLLDSAGISPERARSILGDALDGADDGEIFIEERRSEALVFDNGRLRQASFDVSRGFGMRAVAGETAAYAHSTEITPELLSRAAATVSAVCRGRGGTLALRLPAPTRASTPDSDPLEDPDFAAKVALLAEIDAWLRARDERVRQVTVSLGGRAPVGRDRCDRTTGFCATCVRW